MKASQYMYASWKNAPNKGFAPYSMSEDVTKEESATIELVMRYRAPSDLPYEPTDEEIERLFPRNFAYFRLPTGRYCLAQAAYVGHEFKGFEDGGRMGNYLIHAYLVSDPTDLIPATFIFDDIFRRDLTTEEWRATNPPPLPVVEFPASGKIDPAEIAAFVAEGRSATLKSLVQAVVTAAEEGGSVYLNDRDQRSMRLWYQALELCLPKSIVQKVTFDVFSFEDVNANTKLPPDCRLLISNVTQGGFARVNYQQKMANGAYVFDFAVNTVSAVQPKAYAYNIVDVLAGKPLAATEFGGEVSRICAATGIRVDEAFAVTELLRRNYGWFGSLDALVATYRDACKDGSFDRAAFAEDFGGLVLSGKYAPAEALAFCRELYGSMSDALKTKLISFYADGYFRGAAASSPQQFRAQFASAVPFPERDFAALAFGADGMGYYAEHEKQFRELWLLLDLVLTPENGYSAASTYKYAAKIVEACAAAGDEAGVRTVLSRAIAVGNPNANAFAQTAVSTVSKVYGIEGIPLPWFFELNLAELSDAEKVRQNLLWLFTQYPDRTALVKFYASYLGSHPELKPIDGALRADARCEAFFAEADRYALLSSPMGKPELVQYYRDFYLRGKDDSGVLILRLKDYLVRTAREKGSAALEAVDLFEAFSALATPPREVVDALRERAVPDTLRETEKLLSEPAPAARIRSFVEAIKRDYPCRQFYTVHQGMAFGERNYDALLALVPSQRIYEDYYDMDVEAFVGTYLDRVADFALASIRRKKIKYAEVVTVVFAPLVGARKFPEKLAEALSGSKYRESLDLVAYLLDYALTQGADAKAFEPAAQRCVEALSKRDRKKAFETALRIAGKDAKTVQKYVDDFNASQKKSWIERLFGKKDKKQK